MSDNINYRKKKVFRIESVPIEKQFHIRFEDYHLLTGEGDYEFPEHQHENYELIFVLDGPYRCAINGTELKVDNNEILLIQPGDIHTDHLYRGQKHYVLHFSVISTDDFDNKVLLFPKKMNLENRISKSKGIDIRSYFNWMDDRVKKLDSDSKIIQLSSYFLQDSLLETFFWNLVTTFDSELFSTEFLMKTEKEHFRSKLFKLFEENLSEELPVDKMASEMAISRRSLTLKCRKYINKSPAMLFLIFRLTKSKELLELSKLSIDEISYRLGFANQFHYSRCFKRIYGITPSTYRKSINTNLL